MAARILHHESRQLRKKCFEGRAPFYFDFFYKRCLHDWLDSFLLPISVYHVRSVSFSDGGLCDLDIIFRDFFTIKRTHSHKQEGAKTSGKAEGRQRAVRFTRFLDYRLMFDSGRSFSLKYYLIRSPYPLPRIVDSLTSRLTSVLFRLFPPAFWHLIILEWWAEKEKVLSKTPEMN